MKRIKNKCLVFGYFGYASNQLDGQTVKTRAIYDILLERFKGSVQYADSQTFRKSIKSVIKFSHDLFRCDTLVWLPAHNNLKYLFPLLWVLSKIFRFDIIYIVIGGWLSQFLKNKAFHLKRLKTIKAILLENQLTVGELFSAYGFKNLDIIPNFRDISPRPCVNESVGPLKLVYMARINKMKGLDTISSVAEKIKDTDVIIDFYGPIIPEDKEFFTTQLINKYASLNYCGILQPENIYETLKQYDALIFPTHYYTEGFPGTVMDAYRSALPVIATRWKHAEEFITDGVSGFIVDFDNPTDEIVDIIHRLSTNRCLLKDMKEAAYTESLKYTPDKAWLVLSKYL